MFILFKFFAQIRREINSYFLLIDRDNILIDIESLIIINVTSYHAICQASLKKVYILIINI